MFFNIQPRITLEIKVPAGTPTAIVPSTVFHAKRVEFENRDKKSKSQAKHLHPTSRCLFEITGLLSDFGGINESHKPHPWPQNTF